MIDHTKQRAESLRVVEHPKVVALRRRLLALYESRRLAVATMAKQEGLPVSYVFEMLVQARIEDANCGVMASRFLPPRLPLDTVKARAFDEADRWMRLLGPNLALFWVRLIVTIHQHSDGYGLYFGKGFFHSRDSLSSLGCPTGVADKNELDGWLGELVQRGFLIELENGDLAIPPGLGLLPGENRQGRQMRVHWSRQAASPWREVL